MSACGHQPPSSNRLGESSRLAVFLLFYKEKGFYAPPAGDPCWEYFSRKSLLRWVLIFLSPFTTPYSILDLGSGLKPPQNKHADARG